ncbi:MAG: hypothetical protein AAFR31_18435 [Cyanobacteria bacterium J06627_8]
MKKIVSLNASLKELGCPVKIQQVGKSLYLRGTLPPKLDSSRAEPFQQRIALGVHANPAGLKKAKSEALKIAGYLALGDFSWEPYYTPKEKTETVNEWC